MNRCAGSQSAPSIAPSFDPRSRPANPTTTPPHPKPNHRPNRISRPNQRRKHEYDHNHQADLPPGHSARHGPREDQERPNQPKHAADSIHEPAPISIHADRDADHDRCDDKHR